jgi:DNA-binding NtrC family response regulator
MHKKNGINVKMPSFFFSEVHQSWQIMIASSNLERLRHVESLLARQNVDSVCSSTIGQCREILSKGNIGLVFSDRNLSDGDYRDLLAAVSRRSTKGHVRVVLMHALTKAEEYQRMKRAGIFEVIPTPCRPTDVEWMVIQAKRHERNLLRNYRSNGTRIFRDR